MQFIDLKTQHKKIKTNIDAAINSVLEHGQYILGPEVDILEVKLAEYTGAKFCISCANGTDALQISLMSLGIMPGDEVITPAFNYIASAEAAKVLGAKPIYVDVDPKTFNMDAGVLEDTITSKTKAIISVSLFGQCPDMDKINSIAKKYDIPVIEDAAQSFGAIYKEKKSCNLSSIATTSFFPSKPLGCYGDGGAIFTNEEELAKDIRKIARHGQAKRYYHEVLGINSRLDTIQAAILIEKLKIFDEELQKRQFVANTYNDLLHKKYNQEDQGALIVPSVDKFNISAWAQYTLRHKNRDFLVETLKNAGIPSVIYYPLPLNAQKSVSDVAAKVPNSEMLSKEVFSLPMHPYLEKVDLEKISEIILEALSK